MCLTSSWSTFVQSKTWKLNLPFEFDSTQLLRQEVSWSSALFCYKVLIERLRRTFPCNLKYLFHSCQGGYQGEPKRNCYPKCAVIFSVNSVVLLDALPPWQCLTPFLYNLCSSTPEYRKDLGRRRAVTSLPYLFALKLMQLPRCLMPAVTEDVQISSE